MDLSYLSVARYIHHTAQTIIGQIICFIFLQLVSGNFYN